MTIRKTIIPKVSLYDYVDVRAVRFRPSSSLFRMEVRYNNEIFKQKYPDHIVKKRILGFIPIKIKYIYRNPWFYLPLTDDKTIIYRIGINTITYVEGSVCNGKSLFESDKYKIKTLDDYKYRLKDELASWKKAHIPTDDNLKEMQW